jgi:hypothetical protein
VTGSLVEAMGRLRRHTCKSQAGVGFSEAQGGKNVVRVGAVALALVGMSRDTRDSNEKG